MKLIFNNQSVHRFGENPLSVLTSDFIMFISIIITHLSFSLCYSCVIFIAKLRSFTKKNNIATNFKNQNYKMGISKEEKCD